MSADSDQNISGSALKSNQSLFIVQCNLFKVISDNGRCITSECLVCTKEGQTKYVRGKHNMSGHLRRMHPEVYEQYLLIKDGGIPRPLLPQEDLSNASEEVIDMPLKLVPILYDHGFFEVRMRLPNERIKVNCMTCERMGRPNLVVTKEGVATNLVSHLKRVHPLEYRQYVEMKTPKEEKKSPLIEHGFFEVHAQLGDRKKQVVCISCKRVGKPKIAVYENKSSNLLSHLQRLHPSEYMKYLKLTKSTDQTSSQQNRNHEDIDMDTEQSVESTNKNDDLEFVEVRPNIKIDEEFYDDQNYSEDEEEEAATSTTENIEMKPIGQGPRSTQIAIKRTIEAGFDRYRQMVQIQQNQNQFETQFRKQDDFSQDDLNRIVSKFFIRGMHLPSLLNDPTFDTMLNEVAQRQTIGKPLEKLYHVISPEQLNVEIDNQFCAKTGKLSTTLRELSSVSTAVDVWSTRQKTFMSVAVNWIDSENFNRASNMMTCEVFDNSVTTELLTERLQQIYVENEITNKVLATVTNNSLRFDEEESCTYVELNGLEHQIHNPTHLFELIGSVDALQALNDKQYAEIYHSAFKKLDALSKCLKYRKLSENTSSILKKIFKQSKTDSKVSKIYNNVSNLVNCDREHLMPILAELEIPYFTETEISFFEEYIAVLEPISTAIGYLQNDRRYYASLLPMVYSLKGNLIRLRDRTKMLSCQPLLVAILDGVERRFAHLFDLSSEDSVPAIIATCTHPFFKMRWLKGDLKTTTNTDRILNLLVQVAKEEGTHRKKTEESSDDEHSPPEKQFKADFSFDFESHDAEEDDDTNMMYFLSYLKKPCQNDEHNLVELSQYPLVKKLFLKYNSIISSPAALECSIPLTDLIRKSQCDEFSDEIFSKLCCLRSDIMRTPD